ncbi:MAG: hypothetical protein ACPL25_06230, partial [Ignavibacteria bacterium]
MKGKYITLTSITLILFLLSAELFSFNHEVYFNSKSLKNFNQIRNQLKKYDRLIKTKVANYELRDYNKFQQIPTFTAREKLDSAIYYARNYASDAELRAILFNEDNGFFSPDDSIDGRAIYLSYYFYSNSKNYFAV